MRKTMLVMLGAGALPLLGGNAASAPMPQADLVLVNARIYTSDSKHSLAEAMAVRGGRIVFVGPAAQARALAGPQTQIQDLGGKLVLPGLIDSHVHPERVIEYPACDLDSKPLSLAQIAREVRACIARRNVPPGEWVLVDLWNFSEGMQTDPDHPTIRAALDKASIDHPIKLFGLDGHHFGFNSVALAMPASRGRARWLYHRIRGQTVPGAADRA